MKCVGNSGFCSLAEHQQSALYGNCIQLSLHLHLSPLPNQHDEVLQQWSYFHSEYSVHSKCSVKALWRNGWNEDRRRTLSFFKRRFWRKGERGWLACIWKGKIYLRVGKNPSRFEKETRDSGEEADQMQMRRRMREYDARNMECCHQPRLGLTLKSLEWHFSFRDGRKYKWGWIGKERLEMCRKKSRAMTLVTVLVN